MRRSSVTSRTRYRLSTDFDVTVDEVSIGKTKWKEMFRRAVLIMRICNSGIKLDTPPAATKETMRRRSIHDVPWHTHRN